MNAAVRPVVGDDTPAAATPEAGTSRRFARPGRRMLIASALAVLVAIAGIG